MRILVIEDDRSISFVLKRFFSGQGHEVICCFSLAEAYQHNPNRQDFIIIDLNLPDGDGFEYLAYVRSSETRIPLLIITVRDQENDIIRGLDMGADDYLTKPFSLLVLKARMDAILRRAGFDGNEKRIKCGKLELDKATKTAFLGNKVLDLSAREYELLELFMENQGLILPRNRILDLLWGWERGDVYYNTLTVTVKRLRDKIAPCRDYIQTIRGIGYRMTGGDEQ
jgi:DNA-binding response OmpR family regulator